MDISSVVIISILCSIMHVTKGDDPECAVKMILLPNRMIKLQNGEELCRCLRYESIKSDKFLKSVEACDIYASTDDKSMVFSADSLCKCAGYKTNKSEDITYAEISDMDTAFTRNHATLSMFNGTGTINEASGNHSTKLKGKIDDGLMSDEAYDKNKEGFVTNSTSRIELLHPESFLTDVDVNTTYDSILKKNSELSVHALVISSDVYTTSNISKEYLKNDTVKVDILSDNVYGNHTSDEHYVDIDYLSEKTLGTDPLPNDTSEYYSTEMYDIGNMSDNFFTKYAEIAFDPSNSYEKFHSQNSEMNDSESKQQNKFPFHDFTTYLNYSAPFENTEIVGDDRGDSSHSNKDKERKNQILNAPTKNSSADDAVFINQDMESERLHNQASVFKTALIIVICLIILSLIIYFMIVMLMTKKGSYSFISKPDDFNMESFSKRSR